MAKRLSLTGFLKEWCELRGAGWLLSAVDSGYIRVRRPGYDGHYCPILAVACQRGLVTREDNFRYQDWGEEMGLTLGVAARIAYSADGRYYRGSQGLRERLLGCWEGEEG